MNLNIDREELERIADCLPAGILVFDAEMRIRMWNDTALELTGIGIEDILSDKYSGLLEKKVLSMLADAGKPGNSFHQRIHIEQGKKTIGYTVKPLRYEGRAEKVLIVEDATKYLEMERIKQDFINSLLHKLRGPLSTLKTSLAMLQGKTVEDLSSQTREIIDMGYHEVNRLATLVGDLRDLFIIETGIAEKEMEIEAFPLSSALDRAVEEIGKMAPPFDTVRRRLVRKGSLNVRVKKDFEKLKKVFMILLKNALMYSREQDEVTVECDSDNNSVDIRVRDRGIGLSEKSMPFLFDKYFREDNESTRTHEGNGLGLFIAKSFIELMRGTVYCESVQGKGCVFFVSLPIAGAGNHE
ncbi:MAG: PAS domain-containing protein [Chitinispirillaceae bacterium]|nr:PAS domain-containing protein [Chitinispirillaceae bacterium]